MDASRLRRLSASFVVTLTAACGGNGKPPAPQPADIYKADDGQCFEEPTDTCPPDDGLCNPPGPMPVECPPHLR